MTVPMIRLEQLSFGYLSRQRRNVVMQGAGLTAGEGELVAIIGLNGIGKSTLLKTMAGLLPPLDGKILMRNRSLGKINRQERSRMMTFIAAGWNPTDHISVRELVSLGRHPYTNWFGALKPGDKAVVDGALHLVGIESLANRSVREISDGEQQRTQIARALAQDTPIILMDEPTAFLDVVNRYSITALLKEICYRQRKTIVFSTHDWNVALHHAHKIWLLLPDTVIEGAPEDLALQGHFSKLLEGSGMGFDLLTGRISAPGKTKGEICISLSGPAGKWAAHAMERAGFKLNKEAKMSLETGQDQPWLLRPENGPSKSFDSIYQLVEYLNDNW